MNHPGMALSSPLPKGPVLGWTSFRKEDAASVRSVEALAHVAFTTSGRSAIYHALLQLALPAGSQVLVPTYHCPTMVAPVLLAGHQPVYFGTRADGLPDTAAIPPATGAAARAMIVSHYFGLAQSLHEVRSWCDANGIALIEDCAHSYFGQAGERPIGAWGDYCTASLSKFFPVPEAGLLGSSVHALRPLALQRQGLRAQVKGWVDVLETATRHGHMAGLAWFFALKRKAMERPHGVAASPPSEVSEAAMMDNSDMGRIRLRPLAISMLLRALLPRGRIVAQRQRNYTLYAELLTTVAGGHPLLQLPATPVAPYVFPFWVDDADRIYHTLRVEGFPVFRWDRIWPGTPPIPGDVGADWSRHVLQLLCHQDLEPEDIRRCAQRLLALLQP